MCIRTGGWTDGQSDFNIPFSQTRTRLKICLWLERQFSTHYFSTTYIKLWITVLFAESEGDMVYSVCLLIDVCLARWENRVGSSVHLIRPGRHSNTDHCALPLLYKWNKLRGRRLLKPRIFRPKISERVSFRSRLVYFCIRTYNRFHSKTVILVLQTTVIVTPATEELGQQLKTLSCIRWCVWYEQVITRRDYWRGIDGYKYL